MSLLEDVFLDDEAGEAQELERVIEGDEYDERPRAASDSDDDSEKDDEAVEDKRRVDPTQGKVKRVVKNPRFTLNPARLTGPRGIQIIPEHFKDFKFKGKGNEKDDLDLVLKKLEHWAYRLYPKFEFGDCLKKIETLGKKRPVMVHLHKIRSDQLLTEETVVQRDSSDEEAPSAPPQEEDEFDKLLQQQIELARTTPAPGSSRKGFQTPSVDKRSSLIMPKATSSPSINDEQKERMLRNRKLAEERRLARLQQNTAPDAHSKPITTIDEETVKDKEIDTNVPIYIGTKHNRPNVIGSSDEDDDIAKSKQANMDVEDTRDIEMVTDVPIRRHNRSVIDSDEGEVTLGKSVTVDVHDKQEIDNNNDVGDIVDLVGTNNSTMNKRVHDNNDVVDLVAITTNTTKQNTEVPVIDLVGTNTGKSHGNISENAVIDITNQDSNENLIIDETNIRNMNRSEQITDSSDDECDLTTVNQNITVDVHKSVDSDSNYVDLNDSTAKKAVDNGISTTDDAQITIEHEDLTEKDVSQAITNGNVNDVINMIEELNENYNSELDSERINEETDLLKENKTDRKIYEKVISKTNTNEDNFKDNTEAIDDIMDVDFSDDF